MLDNKVCNCGGTYVNKKGKWVCDSCGRPMPQILDSRANQLLAVAEGKFAQEKFIEAEELYTDIVKSFPDCYPAYWGLTLAKHGIKYVDDLRTGKKVATCWAPEISSIADDKNYKKVLEIAPTAERQYYESQGIVIENIRKEWQEKAKKIKPYDVFICFKDTDDETRGRTEDSIELSDLYNNLTRDKYNVFFSRYSLEGITAENYEPYIFQALSTAKVMIVYGSKEEYFESTWMKNEWTRFLHKIADGQKRKNALLPVVKGCSPSVLPPRLRALQVLDAGKNTFYSDLTRYIDKVLASSEDVVELQRSKIKFDKRQSVSREQTRKIQSRSLQVEDVEIISAQGEQLMKVIGSFVQQKQFERAEKFCDAWIKSNPTNYRDLEELVGTILKSDHLALARKYVSYLVDNAPDRKKPQLWNLMVADGYTDIDKWAQECVSQKHIYLDYMQRVLPLISQKEISVLYAYYLGISNITRYDSTVKEMILYALEFEADAKKKKAFLDRVTDSAIRDVSNFNYFDFVISLLDNAKYKKALAEFVDFHIGINNLPALQKVLPLLEGELYFKTQCSAIKLLFEMDDYKTAVDETQKMLGYADNDELYARLMSDVLDFALNNITSANVQRVDDEVFRLLGFIKDDKAEEEYYFDEFAQRCLEFRYKQGAERYAKLLLACGSEGKYLGYYYLMLLALDCYNDDEVAYLTVDIADTEGYNNWLANCDEEQISLATNYLNTIDELKVKHQKAKEKQIAEKKVENRQKIARGKSRFISMVIGAIAVVSILFSVLCSIGIAKNPLYSDMSTFFIMMLNVPTAIVSIVALLIGIGKIEKIQDKFFATGKRVICCVLIIPFLLANTLVYNLFIARFHYVDDIFYVKQEFDGTQSLRLIDLTDYDSGEMLYIPNSVDTIVENTQDNIEQEKSRICLYIPKTVKTIETSAFAYWDNLEIYCEAESQPDGWADNWNMRAKDIWWQEVKLWTTVWGYEIEPNKPDTNKPNEGGTGTDTDNKYIEYKTEDGVKYNLTTNGYASVAKQDASLSGNIVIPTQIMYNKRNYIVSSIYSNAFQDTKITGVDIQMTNIMTITASMFSGCSNLKSVTLPNSVINIGDEAFKSCGFSTFTIPSSVTTLGKGVFADCQSLTKITIPNKVDRVPERAFSGCTSLKTVSLSSNVKYIDDNAFNNCKALTDITLPDNLSSIGQFAFGGTIGLNKIIIPSSVRKMGWSVFYGSNVNLKIYCRMASAPDIGPMGWHSEWNEGWNYSTQKVFTYNVVWGYKGN